MSLSSSSCFFLHHRFRLSSSSSSKGDLSLFAIVNQSISCSLDFLSFMKSIVTRYAVCGVDVVSLACSEALMKIRSQKELVQRNQQVIYLVSTTLCHVG
ncbi:hypothetical protein Bca4012_038447 [Brassica carinata]